MDDRDNEVHAAWAKELHSIIRLATPLAALTADVSIFTQSHELKPVLESDEDDKFNT